MKKIKVFCIALSLFSLDIKEVLSIKPIPSDMRILPLEIQKKKKEELPLIGRMPYGAGRYNTSEYMIGKVAVGVILPESNLTEAGGGEDWTEEEINKVKQEIEAGFSWWREREKNAGLCFVYEYRTISTSYEPIKKSYREEGLWIKEVMINLGYQGYPDKYSYFEQVYNYINYLREKYNTDWALTVFVVDSSKDEDGMFEDKKFAYAYLGGPFMVMTYDNNNYGIDNMDAVAAHELGHIFYALDEYQDSISGPEDYSGYLNVVNGNHEVGGKINVFCIMRGGIYPFKSGEVCYYTRGHVGFWDNDKDNLLDIVDTGGITLKQTTSMHFEGKATLLPLLPNKNPKARSKSDITVAKIRGVEWRVKGESGWSQAASLDGSFDSVEEEFYFIYDKDISVSDLDLRIRYLIGDKEIVSQEAIEELAAGDLKIEYVGVGSDHGYFNPNYYGEKLKINYFPKKKNSVVHMEIYSYLGQLIYSQTKSSKDRVEFEWNGRDMNNNICASGIYILKIKEEDGQCIIKKVCIMR